MPQSRPFPSSSIESQQAVPPAFPTHPAALRGRLKRFHRRFQVLIVPVAAALLALASVGLYAASRPALQQVTQREINAAVARALEETPNRPHIMQRKCTP